jgi:hypothetical protein
MPIFGYLPELNRLTGCWDTSDGITTTCIPDTDGSCTHASFWLFTGTKSAEPDSIEV